MKWWVQPAGHPTRLSQYAQQGLFMLHFHTFLHILLIPAEKNKIERLRKKLRLKKCRGPERGGTAHEIAAASRARELQTVARWYETDRYSP